jgi:hypothetical protein
MATGSLVILIVFGLLVINKYFEALSIGIRKVVSTMGKVLTVAEKAARSIIISKARKEKAAKLDFSSFSWEAASIVVETWVYAKRTPLAGKVIALERLATQIGIAAGVAKGDVMVGYAWLASAYGLNNASRFMVTIYKGLRRERKAKGGIGYITIKDILTRCREIAAKKANKKKLNGKSFKDYDVVSDLEAFKIETVNKIMALPKANQPDPDEEVVKVETHVLDAYGKIVSVIKHYEEEVKVAKAAGKPVVCEVCDSVSLTGRVVDNVYLCKTCAEVVDPAPIVRSPKPKASSLVLPSTGPSSTRPKSKPKALPAPVVEAPKPVKGIKTPARKDTSKVPVAKELFEEDTDDQMLAELGFTNYITKLANSKKVIEEVVDNEDFGEDGDEEIKDLTDDEEYDEDPPIEVKPVKKTPAPKAKAPVKPQPKVTSSPKAKGSRTRVIEADDSGDEDDLLAILTGKLR